MGDVVLIVEEDLKSASAIAISLCRICHEEEFESSSLEAPCACSGTVKFAHRDCIQRWCNEKGNTVCEICLQKFEPGYTAPPVKASQLVDDAVVTIRGSLEVPRRDMEIRYPELSAVAAEAEAMLETDYPECSFEANRRFTCCRTMAIMFMVLLLARDLLAVVTRGTEHYPFTLMTLLIIRASGIVLPIFVFIRIITAIQKSIKRSYPVRFLNGLLIICLNFDKEGNGCSPVQLLDRGRQSSSTPSRPVQMLDQRTSQLQVQTSNNLK